MTPEHLCLRYQYRSVFDSVVARALSRVKWGESWPVVYSNGTLTGDVTGPDPRYVLVDIDLLSDGRVVVYPSDTGYDLDGPPAAVVNVLHGAAAREVA